jgi:hypothetical protein
MAGGVVLPGADFAPSSEEWQHDESHSCGKLELTARALAWR